MRGRRAGCGAGRDDELLCERPVWRKKDPLPLREELLWLEEEWRLGPLPERLEEYDERLELDEERELEEREELDEERELDEREELE